MNSLAPETTETLAENSGDAPSNINSDRTADTPTDPSTKNIKHNRTDTPGEENRPTSSVVRSLSTAPAADSTTEDTNTPLLSCSRLFKAYRKGTNFVPVLQDATLEVNEGEFVAAFGQSGCGKSTLLHLLGTLDKPDDGEVHFRNRRIDNLSASERDRFRNHDVGFVFQFYHLLPELTALENVLAPKMISHGFFKYMTNRRRLRREAVELLERVGLGHRLHHKPRELSGGEMQRAAIARALINQPRLLLADEPTGNLDAESGAEVMRLLHDLNRRSDLSILMVTHDQSLADSVDRSVRIESGRVVDV